MILQHNRFVVFDCANKQFELIIHDRAVTVHKSDKTWSIKRSCLAGALLFKSNSSITQHKLEIFSIKLFPFKIKLNVFHTVQDKKIEKFVIFHTNLEMLRQIRNLVFGLIYDRPPKANFRHELDMSLYLSAKDKRPRGFRISSFKCEHVKKLPGTFHAKTDPTSSIRYYKKVLITLNPASGKKNAMKIFRQSEDILRANKILFSLFVSQKRGDVRSHVLSMDLDELESLDGIFCFSGDGHVHEVLNGLMDRPDFDMARRPVPIAHFPCGSGCVLSEYMSKVTNSTNSVGTVLSAVCRWRTTPMPLYEYRVEGLDGKETVIHSFLSLSIGFFADVDIESEFLRFLGNGRFGVYGVWRYLILKKYRLRVEWNQLNIDTTTCFGQFGESDEPELVSDPEVERRLRDMGSRFQMNKRPLETIPEKPSIYEEEPSEASGELSSSYSGKLFSLLVMTLPFMSKNHMCSPILLQSLGHFNLQIAPTSMGRSGFYNYISKHENHYPEDHALLIDEVTDQFEICQIGRAHV